MSSVAEPAGMMRKSFRRQKSQRLWAKVVMRKWLNISARDLEYGADTEDESENEDVVEENQDSSSDEDYEESSTQRRGSTQSWVSEISEDPITVAEAAAEFASNGNADLHRCSVEVKEKKFRNIEGGVSPPSDLDIDDWIDINHSADIYVLGLQEVVPLNAGNILAAEDNRPVAKWEEVIREALNRVRPKNSGVKSYSDPPTPGIFKPFDETHDVIEEEPSMKSTTSLQTTKSFKAYNSFKHVAGSNVGVVPPEVLALASMDLTSLMERKRRPAYVRLLVKEYKKGRAFDGWSEGTLQFAPTYKYQAHSDEYTGSDGKATKRTPAWCDRILSFGKGMRLVQYRRTENKFSDHRPVVAIYMAEVEVFSARKLQRALTFTDAEIEDEGLVAVIV
uniref:Inositol polyphosphate-related phosphatase domain-containing protein n=1 Tax=Brassica oleracea var. oleracea TaxID=109376 RepID=A0A0D2ZU22_BRAOL